MASDAVSVAWGEAKAVKRVWVLPFGPKGTELWTNDGVGAGQSALKRVDDKAVGVAVDSRADGYTVTMSFPRAMIFGAGEQARMNIEVSNNDEGAQTWRRSWAREEDGPAGWGLTTVKKNATTEPATRAAP